jgi:hypothetical protein
VEDDERRGQPATMKTDENVEKMRTPVRTVRRVGIRIRAEELNMGKNNGETNFNMKKVCAKITPKNPPITGHKTNTNAQMRSVLARYCPCDFSFSKKLRNSLRGTNFRSTEGIHKRTTKLFKSLSQSDFRRCFEAWKVRVGRFVASYGNYFEVDNM